MRWATALLLGLSVSIFFTPAGAAEESAAPKIHSEAPASSDSPRTKTNKEQPPEEVIQNLELLQNLPLLKEIDLFKEMPVHDKKSDCAETSPGCSKQAPPSRTKGDGEGNK